MAISYIQKGVIIQLGYRQLVIKREIEDKNWQLEDTRTGQFQMYSQEELERFYAKGELIFFDDSKPKESRVEIDPSKLVRVRPTEDPILWNDVKIRLKYAKSIEGLPATRKIVEQAVKEVWKKATPSERNVSCMINQNKDGPPHWATVVHWKNKYLASGKDANALVENNVTKGNRNSAYSKDMIEIIDDVIDRIFLTRERNTIETTLEHARVALDNENQIRLTGDKLKKPTRRLVKGRIDRISAYDRCAARYGTTAAIRKFRSKLKHVVTEERLERAEIDHTQLDLFVLSDDGRSALGRPWVTLCIDNHTRCILGIYIGFEPPSFLSVGRCLKHAFLPKSFMKEDYPDIKNEWNAYGVMRTLVVDNAFEFHGESLEKSAAAFGITIEYTPRKSPWFKGKIERVNRTLNEGVSKGTPGTTFSNIFDKDDYNPDKHAILTLSTLRLIVHKWIADYYHQKRHSGLDGVTPAKMWDNSAGMMGIPMADNPDQVDILLGKPRFCTLNHVGIKVNCLEYNSPELKMIRREYGDKLEVDIRIDESDLGHIYVMHPDKSGFIEVNALNYDYAHGVSIWQHKVCRSFSAKHLGRDDPLTWSRAKVEIAEIMAREGYGRKPRTNTKFGRYQEATKHSKQSSKAQQAKKTRSAITSQVTSKPDIYPIAPVKLADLTQQNMPKKFDVIIETRGK